MQTQKRRESEVVTERRRRREDVTLLSAAGERSASGTREEVMRATVAEWRVPTLRGIQEALVEAGDKSTEFVGSREWIGCFEACLVLDHLFSVCLCISYPHADTEE